MLSILRAAGISALLALSPAIGSAATLSPSNNIVSGSSYQLGGGAYFFGVDLSGTVEDGSYSFVFDNTAAADETVVISIGAALQGLPRFGGGVTVAWAGGDDIFIRGSRSETFELKSIIAANSSDTLSVTFSNPTGSGTGNVTLTVGAVPLPAGGLLLLAALGSAAFLRRRKSVIA